MSERIARVRIALNDIEPEIWRRIQAVMAWQDYHLFEFAIDEKIYGLPDPEWDGGRRTLKAKLAKLETFVTQGITTFDYVYDMGDNWEHTVTIEAIEPADASQKYPRYINGARRAPPEDVGGVPGYYAFIDALSKPRHREQKQMLQWYGGPYNPDDIDILALRLRLGDIAKRRHAGKLAYRKRLKT